MYRSDLVNLAALVFACVFMFTCLCWCFQAEAKKLEDSSLYLSLPATKLELEEKGHFPMGKSSQSLGNCTISKDSFQIATLVCSTKLTQNGETHTHMDQLRLGGLFFMPVWKNDPSSFSHSSPFSVYHSLCQVRDCFLYLDCLFLFTFPLTPPPSFFHSLYLSLPLFGESNQPGAVERKRRQRETVRMGQECKRWEKDREGDPLLLSLSLCVPYFPC